jgi:hypothetical protein
MSTENVSAVNVRDLVPQFVAAAELEVAKTFGVESLTDAQKKICAVEIYRVALRLARESMPKVEKAAKARDFSGTFLNMLARAFGYAIKNGIDKGTWVDTVQKAIDNPIAPPERKKADAGEPADTE